MREKQIKTLRSMAVFAMLGALMFISKLLLEFLPNVHMLALFICVFTLIYRAKALIPIYIFVLLTGVYAGFNLWWLPYLYIWTVLWAVFMLFPKQLSVRAAAILCPIVCGLHGLLYGTLYAPMQALMYHYTVKQMLAWIGAGFFWDVIHCVGNVAMGLLAVPLIRLLERLEKKHVLLSAGGRKKRADKQA